jgi:signal peptidase II
MKYYKYFLLTVGVIILDQIVKLLVADHMYLGEEIPLIGDVFKLHYTLNPGMAFGMKIGGEHGKLILTSFRLVAMVGIAWYLVHLAKKGAHSGLLWAIGSILGGAIGNVIDSTFYGVFLKDNVIEGSPTPWFHGQVVDMFYIDICYCHIPDWIPVFGGQTHALWPIFNIADASIFVGVAVILIWQKKFFKEKEEDTQVESSREIKEDKA